MMTELGRPRASAAKCGGRERGYTPVEAAWSCDHC